VRDIVKIVQKTLDVLLNEARQQRNLTLQFVNFLDTKASLLIAFNGIIITILFTTQSFHNSLSALTFGNFLYILGIIVFLIAIIFAIYSGRLRSYRIDPELRPFIEGYSGKTIEEISKKLISHYVNSFENNLEIVGNKGMWINCSFYITLLGFGVLFVSVLLR
jgi:hypothetical protein